MINGNPIDAKGLTQWATKRAVDHKLNVQRMRITEAEDSSVLTSLEVRIESDRRAPFAGVDNIIQTLAAAGYYQVEYKGPLGAVKCWLPREVQSDAQLEQRGLLRCQISFDRKSAAISRQLGDTTFSSGESFRKALIDELRIQKAKSSHTPDLRIDVDPSVAWGEVFDVLTALEPEKVDTIALRSTRASEAFSRPSSK